jgi:hypothetical protein
VTLCACATCPDNMPTRTIQRISDFIGRSPANKYRPGEARRVARDR